MEEKLIQQPKKMNLMQLTFIVAVNMMGSGIIMLPTNMAQVGLCVAGGVEAVDGEGCHQRSPWFELDCLLEQAEFELQRGLLAAVPKRGQSTKSLRDR